MFVSFFLYIFGPQGIPNSLRKTTKQKNTLRQRTDSRQRLIEHVRKCSGHITQNGVNIWACSLKTRVIYVVALWLLHFSMGSTFNVKYDFILIPCRQMIFEYLRERFYRLALESWTPARSEHPPEKKGVNSFGNA